MDNANYVPVLVGIIQKIRARIFFLLFLFAFSSTVGYFLADAVMQYLFALVRQVVFISPTEAFVTKIKVALALGFIMTLPFLLYIVIGFARTRVAGLSKKGQFLLACGSFLLFLIGVLFCFYVVIPLALAFLLEFATFEMQPMLSAGKLVSFVVVLALAFGLSFELPMAILLLARIGVLDEETLREKRRYAILSAFVVAAIVTPPDVISQTLMAIPLLILYELGIVLAKCFGKKREKPVPTIPPDQQQLYM